jgi:hypothetical protein
MDYSQPRQVVFTDHAEQAMRERGIRRADVLWLLANYDSDRVGNKPWKRELVGTSASGRLKLVIVPLEQEVRVITIHPVDRHYRR